ncbi:MAG: valine--tRNA ligase [Candidatus Geothermincolia bacterium]
MTQQSVDDRLNRPYEPAAVEEHWYRHWLEEGRFHATVDPERRPFTIVIPPPNITGSLHMGHALNNSLQDFIIRRRRMQGYATLWLPGYDHAGIATQNVVERVLAAEGTTRQELGREQFEERVWEWKEQYGSTIVGQLKRLGCSCDWERERFTLDERYVRAVREAFVRYYREGLIYRDFYIINWCPRCQTALSDIEVEHEDTSGKLWHIRYDLEDGSGSVTVATTRPETMLGDTAVAVNPEDPRYRELVGKTLVLPLVGRRLPVIADDIVDPDFGTGAVKVTPAHDPNDFEMGRRHGLEEINILTPDAHINAAGGAYEGLDRYEARERVVADLERQGFLEKIEDHEHAVGHCYRCGTAIEPYLSRQWFVKMKPLAEPAIRAVEEGRIAFVPKRWEQVYFDWMYNIRDWCISRQLWWGHRIPAWHCSYCDETIVDVETPARCACGGELQQDPDVLDTWFSSGLWPFATLGWPEDSADLGFFYPTNVLVTAHDIIFFWVARMIMNGIHFMGEVPYSEVFITALIRDESGKKMSKSTGNVIDPLEVIDRYGTDALRFTLGEIAVPGRDVFLSEARIEGSRHFCNKIWNASRLVLSQLGDLEPGAVDPAGLRLELPDRWILSRITAVNRMVDLASDSYDFSQACKALHDFFWGDFCDWYLEMSKARLYGEDEAGRAATRWVLWYVLERALRLLHPVMPFITEELWQRLPATGPSIVTASWPEPDESLADEAAEREMELLREVITTIRRIRSELRIAPSTRIPAELVFHSEESRRVAAEHLDDILAQAGLAGAVFREKLDDPSGYARGIASGAEVFIPLAGLVDVQAEVARIDKELERLDKDAERSRRKLADEGFTGRAPSEIVAKERDKLADMELKLEKLREQRGLLS